METHTFKFSVKQPVIITSINAPGIVLAVGNNGVNNYLVKFHNGHRWFAENRLKEDPTAVIPEPEVKKEKKKKPDVAPDTQTI